MSGILQRSRSTRLWMVSGGNTVLLAGCVLVAEIEHTLLAGQSRYLPVTRERLVGERGFEPPTPWSNQIPAIIGVY
jgi:hypothetical protein